MAEAVVRLRVDASGANRALNGVQQKTNALQKSFGGLRTAIGGIGITLLARNAVKTSTSFEKLNVRLKLLTKIVQILPNLKKLQPKHKRHLV